METFHETQSATIDDTKIRELEDILAVKEASFAELQVRFIHTETVIHNTLSYVYRSSFLFD